MATIKEVAKLAGVSIGTVSNVLNGKTSNAELIDRVESAMSQLSYRPDANARSLKNTKSKLPVGPCTFSFPTGKSSPGAGVWDLAENQQQ